MSDGLAPRCGPGDHCITCGDEAVAMRVLLVGATGLARCADEDGAEEAVEVSLVEAVAPGDVVLVHAGVALARLERAAA